MLCSNLPVRNTQQKYKAPAKKIYSLFFVVTEIKNIDIIFKIA